MPESDRRWIGVCQREGQKEREKAIRKQALNKNRNFSQFYALSPLRFGSIHMSISRIKGPAFSCLTVRRKGVGYPGRMQISAKRSFENKTNS